MSYFTFAPIIAKTFRKEITHLSFTVSDQFLHPEMRNKVHINFFGYIRSHFVFLVTL